MTKQGSSVGQLTRMDLSSISYPHLPPMSGDQNKCYMAELIFGKQESKQWDGGQIKHLEIWKSRNLGTVAVGWWTELWGPVAVHLAPDGCDF